MTDLVTWLLAQLDADERLARLADSPRRWEAISGDYGPQVRVGPGHVDNAGPEWERNVNPQVWQCDDCPDSARCWMGEAEHIAAWDPTRVLADIEAKRRILALHAPHDDDPGGQVYCNECQRYDGAGRLCETILLLAAPYSSRPGYRDEWRPA